MSEHVTQSAEKDGVAAPLDVAVGRALRVAVAEHTTYVEISGSYFQDIGGVAATYIWCSCGWRSDNGPWGTAAAYVQGMAQARIDHLSNALFASVRPLLRPASMPWPEDGCDHKRATCEEVGCPNAEVVTRPEGSAS